MKKIQLLLIIALAVGGALLIYNHFDKKEEQEIVVNKFASEYTLVDEDNVFEYKSIDEVLNILENGSGIVFLCTPDSQWCQHYALYLNEVLKENKIEKCYYLNIMDDRNLNTIKYQKVLTILEPYIYKDDMGTAKIYMPDLTFVKNGVIIGHDNNTSLVASDAEASSYWTHEKIYEFKLKIVGFISNLISDEEMN